MDDNSDQVETLEIIAGVIQYDKEITDFELEVKVEKMNDKGDIKTEVFEEKNNFQIIGEKRKNEEISNLAIESKKVKEKFVTT